MFNKKKNIYNVVKKPLLIIIFLLLSLKGFAHGDLSIKIKEKTKEILKTPNNFILYYERGLLYQQHIEYKKSLEDYNKSKLLGNNGKDLKYRIAEVNYLTKHYSIALKKIRLYLEVNNADVKGEKLKAQILFNLECYKESLKSYQFVIDNMVDIRPEDILEYCSIILAENNKNYKKTLDAIEIGLDKLGENTLSLQLKKLEYLQDSHQTKKVLQQFNYFILEYSRKEFWYYKKAKYLVKINKPEEANITLQLAVITIDGLDTRFRNNKSIVTLKDQIKVLQRLNNKKL